MMDITAISTNISPLGTPGGLTAVPEPERGSGQPTFLDVFKNIAGDAVSTTNQQSMDRIRIMLGETDDIEQMMLNLNKAEMAVDLLVNVRNATLDAYNDIIRMQV
jgi:flagellar hook-basal body complex protein FliE